MIQSWLCHANAAAALVRPALGFGPRLVWNIRQSVADLASEPRGIRTAIRLNAQLSLSADAIVNNSARGARGSSSARLSAAAAGDRAQRPRRCRDRHGA
ncbi:MAG: hypothetical protein U0575_10235 [Phycisphaerales bacterium]